MSENRSSTESRIPPNRVTRPVSSATLPSMKSNIPPTMIAIAAPISRSTKISSAPTTVSRKASSVSQLGFTLAATSRRISGTSVLRNSSSSQSGISPRAKPLRFPSVGGRSAPAAFVVTGSQPLWEEAVLRYVRRSPTRPGWCRRIRHRHRSPWARPRRRQSRMPSQL